MITASVMKELILSEPFLYKEPVKKLFFGNWINSIARLLEITLFLSKKHEISVYII